MVRRTTPTIDEVRSSLEPVLKWLDAADADGVHDPAGADDADGADAAEGAAAPSRAQLAAAVRGTARYLAGTHPGGAVELRVPPFVAVQCVQGLTHRRGTPPNVIELDPRSWLRLVTGRLSWSGALADGAVSASGSRADLADLLPIAGLAGTESPR